MSPPNSLPQPAWSHSQPTQSLASNQIQEALLDPNSHRANGGSSMKTGPVRRPVVAVPAIAGHLQRSRRRPGVLAGFGFLASPRAARRPLVLNGKMPFAEASYGFVA